VSARIAELVSWRTARFHLAAQVEAGEDTKQATVEEAEKLLAEVEARLVELEPIVREMPEAAYLFGAKGRRSSGKRSANGGSQRSSFSARSDEVTNTPKEGTMAKTSNAAILEETLVALRRAEKSAGTTKWALEGAGAKKNPPTPERKKALQAKLDGELARVAELRAKRDELKPKVKA
jgi:hypothetical protein